MIAANDPASRLICLALLVYQLILLARVIVSWLEFFGVRMPIAGPMRSANELLIDVTEPVLRPLRRIIPPSGRLDLSVFVLFVILIVLRQVFC